MKSNKTDAKKHGNSKKAVGQKKNKFQIPAELMSEFNIEVDSQEEKYKEALEKAKARRSKQKIAPERKKSFNTENELTISRRNLRKTHKKNKNITISALDMGDFAKYSRKYDNDDNKNKTKSKKKKKSKKFKKNYKEIFKRITPNVGDNKPLDIIIHIKMREPNQGVSLETK